MMVQDLRNNITEIEKCFLPPQNPLGTYNKDELLRINAYIALSHSEIENFIESEVLTVCRKSVVEYESTGVINQVILGLLCFSGLTYDEPPENKQNLKNDKNWDDKTIISNKIKKAESVFNNKIRTQNNGIKEKDILNMLLPIGYPLKEIDDVFLTEMNDFGKQRGEIAHTSNINIVTKQQIDPYTIKKRIDDIINQLSLIEENLIRSIAPLSLD